MFREEKVKVRRRRAESRRMKEKAKRLMPNYPGAVKLADHLANCSRTCCGNPRRHFNRRTRAERAADTLLSEYELSRGFARKPEQEQVDILIDFFQDPIRAIASGLAAVISAVKVIPDPVSIFAAVKASVSSPVNTFAEENNISPEVVNGFWYGIEDMIKADIG